MAALARSRAIDAWRHERLVADLGARLRSNQPAEEDFAEVQTARLDATQLREAVAALRASIEPRDGSFIGAG